MIPHKNIIETIAAIEQSFDVNSVRYKDLTIWPLIRIAIFQQLCWPDENYTRKNSPLNDKRQILKVQKEQSELLSTYKSTDILFYSYEYAEYVQQIDGKFYYPFIDSMIELIRNTYNFLKIEVPSPRIQETLPRSEPTMFVNQISHYETDKIESVEGFPELQQVVSDISKVWIDEALFIERARSVATWQGFFAEILSLVQPKAVFVVCYYHIIAMALIRACRKFGITTVDIQHGIQADCHQAYTYLTKMPAEGCDLRPDYFWSWGQTSKDAVEKWLAPGSPHHRSVIGGNLWVAKWSDKDYPIVDKNVKAFYELLNQKSRVILLTMGYLKESLPDFLLQTMGGSSDDWLWLTRMHPFHCSKGEKDQVNTIFRQYGVDNYEIEYATSCSLYDLLKRSDHHITSWSSTFYEALAFNVPTTIINPSGLQVYESDIKRGILAYADTSEALLASIRRGFPNPQKINPSEYIETDREVAENALKTILNHSSQNSETKKPAGFEYPYTMNQLGCTFFSRGYKKAALNSFLSAVEANPDLAIAYNNLAVVHLEAGDRNNALQYFVKALEIAPDDREIALNVVEFLRIVGNMKTHGSMTLIFRNGEN